MIEHERWILVYEGRYEITEKMKIDGGWLYRVYTNQSNMPLGIVPSIALTFTPDIDLTRYQAHLRDAYNQGLKDGREEGIVLGEMRAKEKSST